MPAVNVCIQNTILLLGIWPLLLIATIQHVESLRYNSVKFLLGTRNLKNVGERKKVPIFQVMDNHEGPNPACWKSTGVLCLNQ